MTTATEIVDAWAEVKRILFRAPLGLFRIRRHQDSRFCF